MVTETDRIIKIINNGKQVGRTFSFVDNDETIWSSVGIQMWGGRYKVYIDEVAESQMDAENYRKEIFRSFEKVEEAQAFLEDNSESLFSELSVCKGQRVFNPAFD